MNHANTVSMIHLLFILLLLTIFSTIRLHDLAHLSIAFYTTSTLLLACSALPDLFRTRLDYTSYPDNISATSCFSVCAGRASNSTNVVSKQMTSVYNGSLYIGMFSIEECAMSRCGWMHVRLCASTRRYCGREAREPGISRPSVLASGVSIN